LNNNCSIMNPGKITSGAVGFWGYRLRYVFATVADAVIALS
jgi:hypothetical protein